MPITSTSVFQRSSSATHQTVAGEAIVIDLNTGSYYSLNETGTWLWEHLDGQRPVADLARELAAVCEIPDQAAAVQNDLIELLDNLSREKLVLAVQSF
jgi:hypothetical protein